MRTDIGKRSTEKWKAACALALALGIDWLGHDKGWLYDQLRQHRYKWDQRDWIYAPGIRVGIDNHPIQIEIKSDRLILGTVADLVIKHLQAEDLALTHRHQSDDKVNLEFRIAKTK